MEIEVGEYIRTNEGEIGKITRLEKDLKSELIYFWDDTKPEVFLIEDITKHSKNIIDLIEVGDYVNGREVKHIALFEGFPDYLKLIFVDETHLLPNETCENDEIKTILTHEQYENNCYKVVE